MAHQDPPSANISTALFGVTLLLIPVIAFLVRTGEAGATSPQVQQLAEQQVEPRASTVSCQASKTTLCLLDGRLSLTARFRDQHNGGREGQGHTHELTDRTGAFWFFSEDNLEVMIKAINGNALNQHLWVYFGSLSDVEYWIDVEDTQTRRTRTYYNPPGNTYGVTDTQAFPLDDPAGGGPGAVCGGILGAACKPGQDPPLFCDLEPGSCNGADFQGICTEVGEVCPEFFDPVCGCDGKTYSNDCFRIAARVAKDHDGACQAP